MGNFVVTRSFVYANCIHVCRDERHFHSIQSGSLCTHVNGWEFDLNEEEKNYRFNSWKFIWHWRPLNISHFYPHRHDCQLNQNWVNNSSPHQTHPFRFVRGKKIALYKHTEKKNWNFLIISWSSHSLLLIPTTTTKIVYLSRVFFFFVAVDVS